MIREKSYFAYSCIDAFRVVFVIRIHLYWCPNIGLYWNSFFILIVNTMGLLDMKLWIKAKKLFVNISLCGELYGVRQ